MLQILRSSCETSLLWLSEPIPRLQALAGTRHELRTPNTTVALLCLALPCPWGAVSQLRALSEAPVGVERSLAAPAVSAAHVPLESSARGRHFCASDRGPPVECPWCLRLFSAPKLDARISKGAAIEHL